MTILIADSGSTKTSWCLLDKARQMRVDVETQGINPIHLGEEQICGIIRDELLAQITTHLSDDMDGLQVCFYGAGCIGEARERLAGLLQRELKCCGEVAVTVESDLLGAARALCGHQAGIACILGTGANSCWYDGCRIVENVPPLGYILGDEGSGAVLGKLFFNALFKGRLPEKIKTQYLEETGLSYIDVIDKTYRQPLANRFLASTSVFIKQHIHDCPQLRQLVVDNFRDFFRNNVARYMSAISQSPLLHTSHFIGSMAYVYEKELREAAVLEGYEVGKVEKNPMEGLVEYHCN